jgi:hypothetical protein
MSLSTRCAVLGDLLVSPKSSAPGARARTSNGSYTLQWNDPEGPVCDGTPRGGMPSGYHKGPRRRRGHAAKPDSSYPKQGNEA